MDTAISILKSIDSQGRPCVAVILSQNAFMEMSDTHEPYPGVALSPEAALQAAEKILATVREIVIVSAYSTCTPDQVMP